MRKINLLAISVAFLSQICLAQLPITCKKETCKYIVLIFTLSYSCLVHSKNIYSGIVTSNNYFWSLFLNDK